MLFRRALFLILGIIVWVHSNAQDLKTSHPEIGIQNRTVNGGVDLRTLDGWRFSFDDPEEIADGQNLRNSIPVDIKDISEIKELDQWNNYGWFELQVQVDSALAGIPFKIVVFNQAPAKVWVNGKLVLESGNPSKNPENERLARWQNPTYEGLTLRPGSNSFLVEYSEHSVPWMFRPIESFRNGVNIALSFNINSSMRRLRGVVFGGVIMLLLLLVLIHAYLWKKFRQGYHLYVSLTTFFMLLHAFTTLSDTVIDWSFSYRYFYEFSYATGFAFVIFFYLISIRKFFDLRIHWKGLLIGLFVIVVSAVYSVVAMPSLINVINPGLGIPTFLYGSYALYEAKQKSKENAIAVIAIGFLVTVSGAVLYAFAYIALRIDSTFLLLISTLLAYTGVPISLTFVVAQNYAKLIATLEQKVKDRTAALEASNEYRTRFFANISHEFRTPLTISEGLVGKVIDAKTDDAFIQEEMGIVKRNLKRLHDMVDQIIDLTKSDEQKVELNRKNYQANELVSISVESFRSMAENKKIEFEFFPSDEKVNICVDRPKMEIMINNLISNAIKFTPKGGKITISTSISENTFNFTVQDTGPGIPKDELEAVFERFYRINRKEEDYVEGMGVGLELSRTLARLHDGDITIDASYTSGALFQLWLPVEVGEGIITEVVQSIGNGVSEGFTKTDAAKEKKDYNVLLVEDNPDMARYVSEILGDLGEVHQATNGEEALQMLKTLTPDIIITDLMMPKMGGQKFVERLTENKNWKKIPVVVLTAKALDDDKLSLLRIGVVDYITKPFQPEQLLLKTRNLLSFYTQRLKLEVGVSESDLMQAEGLKEKVAAYISKNVANKELSVDLIATEFSQSRRSFYRNIQLETGMTPASFIREVRLTVAQNLVLGNKKLNLEELADSVGYKSALGFRRAYEQRFGEHPISKK